MLWISSPVLRAWSDTDLLAVDVSGTKSSARLQRFWALISLHHQMAFVSRTSRSPVTEAVCSEFPKCAKLFPVSL